MVVLVVNAAEAVAVPAARVAKTQGQGLLLDQGQGQGLGPGQEPGQGLVTVQGLGQWLGSAQRQGLGPGLNQDHELGQGADPGLLADTAGGSPSFRAARRLEALLPCSLPRIYVGTCIGVDVALV